jgi:hypothetical protein
MLASESYAAPAHTVIDHLSVHDLALVGYKASHTLSDLHLGPDSIVLRSQALCYGIEIHYFLKHSQALPLRCRWVSLVPIGCPDEVLSYIFALGHSIQSFSYQET